MPWGTFSVVYEDDGTLHSVHVVPCQSNGEVRKPHEVTEWCPCRPAHSPKDPMVIVHNEIH